MKATESRLRTTGTAEELRFYGRENAYPIEKARSLLGYDPLVGMNEGIARSVSWLRHHGYLDGSLRV
jgi:nucleoside-diphosphate-sugar epimerase